MGSFFFFLCLYGGVLIREVPLIIPLVLREVPLIVPLIISNVPLIIWEGLT